MTAHVLSWWSSVTPAQATLLAASGVLVVGTLTLVQRLRTDRRDQWWKRAQWAIDLTVDEREYAQTVGWAALDHLAASGEATRGDRRLFLRVMDAAFLAEVPDPEAPLDTAADGDDHGGATTSGGEPDER